MKNSAAQEVTSAEVGKPWSKGLMDKDNGMGAGSDMGDEGR